MPQTFSKSRLKFIYSTFANSYVSLLIFFHPCLYPTDTQKEKLGI